MIPTHWQENDLSLDGVSLHYYRTGFGNKPPIVLLHGFSDNGLCWLQTALDLEEHYDVIMPDARGHGLSERIVTGNAVDMTSDLAGIILALGLHQPIVAGHSMGAMVSFSLAVRYPEIARALVLEDPPWFQNNQNVARIDPDEHPMAPWVATINELSIEELIVQTREENPTWPEWVIDTWCPAKKQLDSNVLSILGSRETDWQDNVPRLMCPTLIITADPEKGGIVTPKTASRVSELNNLITVCQIQGTGHHIRFEDYESYMRCVHEFLREIQ